MSCQRVRERRNSIEKVILPFSLRHSVFDHFVIHKLPLKFPASVANLPRIGLSACTLTFPILAENRPGFGLNRENCSAGQFREVHGSSKAIENRAGSLSHSTSSQATECSSLGIIAFGTFGEPYLHISSSSPSAIFIFLSIEAVKM